jgi:hypothetical protein
MHEFRTLDSVRLTWTLSVSYLRFSISPLYLPPAPPADEGGAGDDAGADAGAGAGDPEPTFAFFEFFSCSTSFFHLLTSSAAARAISLLGFERSLPTKTPAFVAYECEITVLVDSPH